MNDRDAQFLRRLRLAVVLIIVGFICAVVATFGIWRLRLKSSVNRQLGAIRAAGLPTSGRELNAWYLAVPAASNAALVCMAAAEILERNEGTNAFSKIKLPARGAMLTPELRKELGEIVARNQPVLALVRQGIRLPVSRYEVDFGPGLDAELPHLARIRGLATLVQFEAVVAAGAQDSAAATESVATSFGLARTLDLEPALISQLVRLSAIEMGCSSLERMLTTNKLTDAQLLRLTEVLDAVESTNAMQRAMVGERAQSIPLFGMTKSDIEHYANTSNDDNGGTKSTPLQNPGEGPKPLVFQATGFFEIDLNFYLQVMATNIAAAASPPPQNLKLAKSADEMASQAKGVFHLLSGLLLPSLSKAIEKSTLSAARVRAARVAVAIERYHLANGRMPESLDKLVPAFLNAVPTDPFNGSPLLFKPRGGGYVVYSVGPNLADDGGLERPSKGPRNVPYDVTFIVEK